MRAVVVSTDKIDRDDKDEPESPNAKRARVADDAQAAKQYCASYICRTPPILGRLDVEKAKALGVPPGPLYGKLKNGQSVTLRDGRVILPEEVVGATQLGGSCAIIHCLTVAMIERIAYAA